jgi:hypothetical protein
MVNVSTLTTLPIRTLNPYSPFPHSISSERQNNPFFFMSLTGQATSPSISPSNTQLIFDAALADYAQISGVDLSKTPFAAVLEQSNTPEAILQLLQGRETAFSDYRNVGRKLMSCLTPAVRVLQAFSDILGESVGVSHIPSGEIFLT